MMEHPLTNRTDYETDRLKPASLSCHGNPKGSIDITGGKREGGKLGQLAGAMSFVIYTE
ncbi:hypothetical protein [Candidatus Reidiella endopervernicosa]|uniref:Uncharacterized protein n=1 Tax=Candidatus Reidiella endopervernicosa TaxID=2738883 RepID=A0A6N0HYM0_9GAMM|nr:hypothetical protein [Candidatus Reidiella endopervernicosa]QKQ27474.1 hypothetical protein HUE57_15175 [Candidatus Reidiella endopervernicosa]